MARSGHSTSGRPGHFRCSRCRRGSSHAAGGRSQLSIDAASTSRAADRLNPHLKPTRRGMASTWLHQVPGASGTGHGVEQVGPVRLPRRLVQEEPVQRQTGVGHLLHALAREHVGAGHRPEEGVVDSRPGDGGALGQKRRPEDAVARLPDGVWAVAARKGGQTKRQRMELVGREYVQRATGVGARTDDQHPAKGCRCSRHGRRAGRGAGDGRGASTEN